MDYLCISGFGHHLHPDRSSFSSQPPGSARDSPPRISSTRGSWSLPSLGSGRACYVSSGRIAPFVSSFGSRLLHRVGSRCTRGYHPPSVRFAVLLREWSDRHHRIVLNPFVVLVELGMARDVRSDRDLRSGADRVVSWRELQSDRFAWGRGDPVRGISCTSFQRLFFAIRRRFNLGMPH